MGRKRLPQRGKRYAYLPYRSSRGRRLRRALTTIVELLTPRCRMGRFWIRIFLVGYLAKTFNELQASSLRQEFERIVLGYKASLEIRYEDRPYKTL